MDKIFNNYNITPLSDDIDCIRELGIAFQRNRENIIEYGDNYWQHYVKLEHTPIAIKLNNFRCDLVEFQCLRTILDVGVGCCEFLKKLRLKSYGYDVNEYGVKWLKDRNLYLNPYTDNISHINGITLWDVIEHLQEPNKLLELVPENCYLFISTPIFDDLDDILKSKHKKIGEHLQYFTEDGLKFYLKAYNFDVLQSSDEETKIGREGIKTFVFRKQ